LLGTARGTYPGRMRIPHLLFALLLVSCAESSSSPYAESFTGSEPDCPAGATHRGDAYPDGLALWCETDTGLLHGPSVTWWANGNRKSEMPYDRGVRSGVSWEWYESGGPYAAQAWADDWLQGAWATWYENGQRHFEGFQYTIFIEDGRSTSTRDCGPLRSWLADGSDEFEGASAFECPFDPLPAPIPNRS